MSGDKIDQVLEHLESLHTKHDALKTTCDTFGTRIDALEAERERADAAVAAAKGVPRADATDENRNAFATAQLRLDAACQAFGFQCRAPLAGESLRSYRASVLNGLKQHSRAYKDSDLTTIGDESAFTNIERMIIADAIEASVSNIVTGAPLRKRVYKNESGHTVTEFIGDPLVAYARFMGGQTRFGRFGNGRPRVN
jgi:hypothetical protein